MYTIYRRDKTGDLIEVAQADTREEAEKFLKRRQGLFPVDQYELREVEAKPPEAAE